MAVAIASDHANGERIAHVVGGLLGGSRIAHRVELGDAIDVHQIVTARPTTPSGPRAWIDATSDTMVVIYVASANGERVFVRKLLLTHGLDEGAREEIAHIAYDALTALLSGLEIGFTREQAREALAEPSPLPRSPAPPSAAELPRRERPLVPAAKPEHRSRAIILEPQLAYEATRTDTSGRWSHGPSFSAQTFAELGALRVGVLVGAHLQLPATIVDEGVSVRVEGRQLRTAAVLELPVVSHVTVRLGLGAVVERVDARAQARRDYLLSRGETRTSLDVAGRGLALVAWTPFRPLVALFGLHCDVPFHADRFAVDRPTGQDVLVDPAAVRLGLFAGIGGSLDLALAHGRP